jgi:hypothetical protein
LGAVNLNQLATRPPGLHFELSLVEALLGRHEASAFVVPVETANAVLHELGHGTFSVAAPAVGLVASLKTQIHNKAGPVKKVKKRLSIILKAVLAFWR